MERDLVCVCRAMRLTPTRRMQYPPVEARLVDPGCLIHGRLLADLSDRVGEAIQQAAL